MHKRSIRLAAAGAMDLVEQTIDPLLTKRHGTPSVIFSTTAAASGWARGYVTIGAGSTDIGGASDRASA